MGVLHPPRRGPGQHAVDLAPREGAVDEDQQERIEDPRLGRRDVRERALNEEGYDDRQDRPERPHRTESVRVASSEAGLRTRTSSRRSKRAEGATTTSRKRPEPAPTERTRPTTRPLG